MRAPHERYSTVLEEYLALEPHGRYPDETRKRLEALPEVPVAEDG